LSAMGFASSPLKPDWPDAAELDRFIRQHGVWGEHSAFTHSRAGCGATWNSPIF
jgi:hypothetical protein